MYKKTLERLCVFTVAFIFCMSIYYSTFGQNELCLFSALVSGIGLLMIKA